LELIDHSVEISEIIRTKLIFDLVIGFVFIDFSLELYFKSIVILFLGEYIFDMFDSIGFHFQVTYTHDYILSTAMTFDALVQIALVFHTYTNNCYYISS